MAAGGADRGRGQFDAPNRFLFYLNYLLLAGFWVAQSKAAPKQPVAAGLHSIR